MVAFFIFYLLTTYLLLYWLILVSCGFGYTNYLLYNILLKKNIRVKFNLTIPLMTDRSIYKVLKFFLLENPRVKSLLFIYILISPRSKSQELLPILKRLFLNRILIVPI